MDLYVDHPPLPTDSVVGWETQGYLGLEEGKPICSQLPEPRPYLLSTPPMLQGWLLQLWPKRPGHRSMLGLCTGQGRSTSDVMPTKIPLNQWPMGSWWLHHCPHPLYGITLRGVLNCLPEFPSGIRLQLPTVVNYLITHDLFTGFPSLPPSPLHYRYFQGSSPK